MSQAEIAKDLNISRMMISKLWKQFHATGTAVRRPEQCRLKAEIPMEVRNMTNTRRYKDIAGMELAQNFATATGKTIS
ncbi:hypothetical protein TNCV_750461 [Trichonephila clavipes]|nr:hypothetical protein TNCV_750461 [Trichonephila clavipes]